MSNPTYIHAVLAAALVALAACGDAPLHPLPADGRVRQTAVAFLDAEREHDSDDPSRGGKERLTTVTSGPVPMQTPDGSIGVHFNLHAEVGGSAAGTIMVLYYSCTGQGRPVSCDTGKHDATKRTTTTFVVDEGTLSHTEIGYHFVLHGWAITTGEGTTVRQRVRSELLLTSGEAFEDGDSWIISGGWVCRKVGGIWECGL